MELVPLRADVQFLERAVSGRSGESCEGWQHCQFTTCGQLETEIGQ
jgi:hypothetical protein